MKKIWIQKLQISWKMYQLQQYQSHQKKLKLNPTLKRNKRKVVPYIQNDQNIENKVIDLPLQPIDVQNPVVAAEISEKNEMTKMMQNNMNVAKVPNIFRNSTFNNCTINFQIPQ